MTADRSLRCLNQKHHVSMQPRSVAADELLAIAATAVVVVVERRVLRDGLHNLSIASTIRMLLGTRNHQHGSLVELLVVTSC